MLVPWKKSYDKPNDYCVNGISFSVISFSICMSFDLNRMSYRQPIVIPFNLIHFAIYNGSMVKNLPAMQEMQV